jgi:hypothetical protein
MHGFHKQKSSLFQDPTTILLPEIFVSLPEQQRGVPPVAKRGVGRLPADEWIDGLLDWGMKER